MKKQSAGVLLYKVVNQQLWVFLVHPGGPFWKNKDLGSWSVPKGEFDDTESPIDAAIREFNEETGILLAGDFIPLTPVKLKSGKTILAFAIEGDINANSIRSNTFEIEWPPRSGKIQSFPEVDRGEWFEAKTAFLKINEAQGALITELLDRLKL